MTEQLEIPYHINIAPTEILINIFCFLPLKEFMSCRLVCTRWKSIIDRLANNDGYWINVCRRDFKDIYWTAKQKAKRELDWYSLYRSLYLWPKIAQAEQKTDEFAPASRISDEVRSLQILGNGVISVHRKGVIEFYSTDTCELAPRKPIEGDYARYTENENVVAFQTYNLHLYVHRRVFNSTQEAKATFDDVKSFYLVDTDLYYVKLNDKIYYCDLSRSQKITSQYLLRTEDRDDVMCLGYKNGSLHVLTYQRNIYTIVNTNLVLQKSITSGDNVINILHQYNFLEQLDWRVYFQWMYTLRHILPQGPMRDIITIRPYGDMYFVGTSLGVLNIFHCPFVNGEVDLYNTKPVKQINFMERTDIPILAICPILQIDVMETVDGHTVFVAMPKKVAVLKYSHGYNASCCEVFGEMELCPFLSDDSSD